MKLNDGSVIPSFMSGESPFNTNTLLQGNFALRSGIVTGRYDAGQQGNVNGRVPEYTVTTVERMPNGSINLLTHYGCIVASMFGLPQNYMISTLTPDATPLDEAEEGSVVLILSLNGTTSHGNNIIIGTLPHPQGSVFDAERGDFTEFQFNGINLQIDKDGQLIVEQKTPLDFKGEPTEEGAEIAGTKITVDKVGGIKLEDNEGQSIEMSRANKTIVASNGTDSITISKETNSINIKTDKEINLEASSTVNVKAEEINLGENASIEAVLGQQLSTYLSTLTVPTPMGPSGPPIIPPDTNNANPATSFLSDVVKIKGNI